MNPTWDVFEQRVAALEGGVAAVATASGQAAVTYSRAQRDAGGRQHRLGRRRCTAARTTCSPTRCRSTASRCGSPTPTTPAPSSALADEQDALVFAETIGNPKLNVVDIAAWADAAHAAGLPLVVDNTVPTPIHCRVFDHGADVAVHSATKYIGGHGTSIGGVVVDSGRFDWTAQAERFPGLTQPDPSYHGVVWSRRARARPRTSAACAPCSSATPAPRSRRSTRSCSCRASRRCRCGWSATRRTPLPWRSTSRRTTASTWVNYPGLESSPSHERRRPDPDGRLRRPRHVRDRGRRRGRPVVHREPRALQPPREHRRREVAGDPQRLDDALAAERRGARGGGRDAGHRAALGRHRAHRRHPRRPRPGAREGAHAGCGLSTERAARLGRR